jgi:hypothetical protein
VTETAHYASPPMVDGGDPKPGNAIAGYAVATVAVVLATIAVVAMIGSFAGGSEGDAGELDPDGDVTVREVETPKLLPGGGLFKVPEDVDGPKMGAAAADCELKSFRARTRDHVAPGGPPVEYSSKPPTSGRHHPVPAPDGAYEEAPDVERLVHTLEHSRVIIWFKRDLPVRARTSLRAYYDSDKGLMVLVPDTTGMDYEVAATAWTAKPGKDGTGHLLGCDEYTPEVFTALQAFKEAYRGKGLELVP